MPSFLLWSCDILSLRNRVHRYHTFVSAWVHLASVFDPGQRVCPNYMSCILTVCRSNTVWLNSLFWLLSSLTKIIRGYQIEFPKSSDGPARRMESFSVWFGSSHVDVVNGDNPFMVVANRYSYSVHWNSQGGQEGAVPVVPSVDCVRLPVMQHGFTLPTWLWYQ